MATKTIHDITLAGALDGSEEVELQLTGGGLSKRTTTQDVAALAPTVAALLKPAYRGLGDFTLAQNTGYVKFSPNTGDPAETWTLPAAPANGDRSYIRTFKSAGGDAGGTATIDGNGEDILAAGVLAPTLSATGFFTATADFVYVAALAAWVNTQ